MNSEIKIPTLLGLGILIAGLTAGILLVSSNQIFKTKAAPSVAPKNIKTANISATSASIYWQTDQAINSFIQAGTTTSLGLTFRDDRDSQTPQPHQLHFVTLTNLTPNTTYYYKINSGAETFPPSQTLNFKTGSLVTPSNYQPIIGTIVDANLQPISEALISLELPDAQNLATITKVAGNFILPLADLKTQDLSANFQIPEAGLSGQLVIFNLDKSSRANIKLPLQQQTLPPITLGTDLDLTVPTASPTADMTQFDLNNDGVANALDRSIIFKNFGKNPKDKNADLNHDGVVDQKDITLFDQAISRVKTP